MKGFLDNLQEHVGRFRPLPGEQEDYANEILAQANSLSEAQLEPSDLVLVLRAFPLLEALAKKFNESTKARDAFAQAQESLAGLISQGEPSRQEYGEDQGLREDFSIPTD